MSTTLSRPTKVSSGGGTITTATTNGFLDWPSQGWAHIKDGAVTR